ncbi:hypothetical protein N431DRAFT_452152 [Stipitochalara longipes BDJ]|nr:hypothetical protein N431DRAFT_452152 [Stipitochalara longipes BDJ]
MLGQHRRAGDPSSCSRCHRTQKRHTYTAQRGVASQSASGAQRCLRPIALHADMVEAPGGAVVRMKTRGAITERSVTLDVLDLIKTPAASIPAGRLNVNLTRAFAAGQALAHLALLCVADAHAPTTYLLSFFLSLPPSLSGACFLEAGYLTRDKVGAHCVRVPAQEKASAPKKMGSCCNNTTVILPADARISQAEGGIGGIAALAAENGFVGIPRQKEERQMCIPPACPRITAAKAGGRACVCACVRAAHRKVCVGGKVYKGEMEGKGREGQGKGSDSIKRGVARLVSPRLAVPHLTSPPLPSAASTGAAHCPASPGRGVSNSQTANLRDLAGDFPLSESGRGTLDNCAPLLRSVPDPAQKKALLSERCDCWSWRGLDGTNGIAGSSSRGDASASSAHTLHTPPPGIMAEWLEFFSRGLVMERGAWSMEHGAWSMEHGAWSMEVGTCACWALCFPGRWLEPGTQGPRDPGSPGSPGSTAVGREPLKRQSDSAALLGLRSHTFSRQGWRHGGMVWAGTPIVPSAITCCGALAGDSDAFANLRLVSHCWGRGDGRGRRREGRGGGGREGGKEGRRKRRRPSRGSASTPPAPHHQRHHQRQHQLLHQPALGVDAENCPKIAWRTIAKSRSSRQGLSHVMGILRVVLFDEVPRCRPPDNTQHCFLRAW